MKVPISWLREFVDINLPTADLANRLTMAGSEVKGTQTIGGNWENVVVGQIVAINPHPNADRLRLTTVDLGTEQQTVVCGAPNLKLNDKVPFASVDAQLINPHDGKLVRLQTAKIRGVESSGMVCSEKELGISENHEGIMVLPAEAPVGTPLSDYLGDVIFDLDITPNRPDCLSVIGVAREAAALTGQSTHITEVSYEESTSSVEQHISVEILAPELCPRYCASLITGIEVAESPPWMQQRLLTCGMRPINNIVDVTNYVMLEYGQPLHSFDYERIRGKKIVVRRAAQGEETTTLDGIDRVLSGDTLVIADVEGTVAIAGVMGGANSEVTEQTTSILLEAASFNPASIHYTGRSLSLPSEACMRFERGISPKLTLPALKRATQLIIQLAGGKAAKGIIDEYPGKKESQSILLSAVEVKRILGIEYTPEQMTLVLTSLGFECKSGDSSSELLVTAPYWRSDIRLDVDLIEEVARISGYDNIRTTLLSQPLPRINPDPIISLKQKARYGLTGYGFQEVITYSLTSLEWLNRLMPVSRSVSPEPLRMANPMTAEQEYLRPHLRANLLAALAANRKHEDGGIRLFELGRVYISRPGDIPDEPEVLCGILSGPRVENWWQGGDESLGFYDAKGVVEGLLNQLGVEADFEECSDESFHPSRQIAITVDSIRVGIVGELHPEAVEAFDITGAVYLFEINLAILLPATIGHKIFQPIPRFPAVVRDIALIVDTGITHKSIQEVIRGFPLVTQVTIFDVYAGEQVQSGKKSLAYRITFQSTEHTLTDEEVNEVQQKILNELSKQLGATLRT